MTMERRALLPSLGGNLALFILLPLLLNGLIFGLGWNQGTRAAQGQLPGVPPGWVVGTLWMVLFAGMGVARWLLVRVRGGRWSVTAEGVSLLGILCLLYPLYTSGLRDDRVGLIGNVLTVAVAIPLTVVAWRRTAKAGACIAAVCAWLLYAAAATAVGLYRG